MDCTNDHSKALHRQVRSPAKRLAARAVLTLVCAAGLWCIARALLSPGMEWRALSIAALAFALGPLTAQFRLSDGRSMSFSLTHPTYFAGVIALGPAGAALPAAFGGVAMLLSSHGENRPLWHILYTILKPAAVCSLASLAYVGAGGNVLCPQAVDSFGPFALAAVVYAGASAVLVGAIESAHGEEPNTRPSVISPIAGWGVCMVEGYMIAVLYSVAPTYVLLMPAGVAILARAALRHPTQEPEVCVETEEGEPDPAVEPDQVNAAAGGSAESASFVDAATGLANRKYAEMFLGREISRSERRGRPVSVAVVDIDGSRVLLDESPKAVDTAIGQMGKLIQAELRDYDVVARYSASRLLVTLPESNCDQTFEICERLRETVGSVAIEGKPISVSIGVAAFPEHAQSADDLVNAAHRALNRAKFSGPNTVCGCDDLEQAS